MQTKSQNIQKNNPKSLILKPETDFESEEICTCAAKNKITKNESLKRKILNKTHKTSQNSLKNQKAKKSNITSKNFGKPSIKHFKKEIKLQNRKSKSEKRVFPQKKTSSRNKNFSNKILSNSIKNFKDQALSKYKKVIESNPKLKKLNLGLTRVIQSNLNSKSTFFHREKFRGKKLSKSLDNPIEFTKETFDFEKKEMIPYKPKKKSMFNQKKILKSLEKRNKNAFLERMQDTNKKFSDLSISEVKNIYSRQILENQCSHPVSSYFSYFFGNYSVMSKCDCSEKNKKTLSLRRSTEKREILTRISTNNSKKNNPNRIKRKKFHKPKKTKKNEMFSNQNCPISSEKFKLIKMGLQNLNFDVILHEEFFGQKIALKKQASILVSRKNTINSGKNSINPESLLKMNTINQHRDNYTVRVKTTSNLESHEVCKLGTMTGTHIDLSKIDFSQSDISKSKFSRFGVILYVCKIILRLIDLIE